MKHWSIKIIPLLLFFVFACSACKKEVVGPQGDKGAAGKKGNLKQSVRSFTVNANSWTFNGGWYATDVYFPEITDDVITKGEIKVYMNIGGKWWTLPYAVGDIFMEQTSEVGLLHLKYSKIHGGPPPSPGQVTFRVVVYAPV